MGQKEDYWEKMNLLMSELNIKIELLRAKAERASGEAKADHFVRIDELRAKQTAVRQKLSELKGPGERWEEARDGVERAWLDLKQSLEKAWTKIVA